MSRVKRKVQSDTPAVNTTCGHINRHAVPNIVCILAKGHDGDHTDGTPFGWWSDGAGHLPTPVVISQEEDAARKSKDNQRFLAHA